MSSFVGSHVPGGLSAIRANQQGEVAGGGCPRCMEIANASSECIFWVKETDDGRTCFHFVNRAFEETTGWTQRKVRSVSPKELLTPAGYELLRDRALRERSGSQRSPHPEFISIKGMKGNRVELELQACLVLSLQPLSVLSFCRRCDRIPDHARCYYELYDNGMDCSFTLNRNRWIDNGNKKFQELTGCRRGMLSQDLFGSLPPENARSLVRFLEARLQGEKNPRCQLRWKGLGGDEKYLDVITIPNPARDGEIIVNIRDVTTLRRLEEEIRESEEKYRSLVEQSRDLIFVLAGDEIVFANSILHVIAEEPKKNERMIWKDYLHRFVLPPDLPRVLSFFRKASQQALDRNTSIEFKIKDKNGTVRDILLTMDTINYRGQKAQIGIARDITERKNLEQKTKETEKLKTLAQFTASLAHEIRNPLEALTSAVQLLLRSLQVQGENRDLLNVIRNTADEISSTVNQVVSMVHEPKYNFSAVDVRGVVAGAIHVVRQRADYDPRVRIETRFQRGIGTLIADESMLRKALVNLLANACQAIDGAGLVRIQVAQAQQGRRPSVSFTVRDTGRGIPASILPQLCEPFVASTKKRGMGLGLFITKRIIEDHGGSISVVRTGEKGTTFRFTIPVEPVRE